MSRILDVVAHRYADELRLLLELLDSDVPMEELESRRRVIDELAVTYQTLHQLRAQIATAELQKGEAMSDRVYVFTRHGRIYECTLQAPEVPVECWTVHMGGCEVEGPVFSGREFTSQFRTEAFEDLAVAAIQACVRPCAVR